MNVVKSIIRGLVILLIAATSFATQANEVRVTTAYIDAKISLDYPGFEGLSVDSLGKEHFPLVAMIPPANPSPINAEVHGSRVEYRRMGANHSEPPSWVIEVGKDEICLESQWTADDPPEPLVLNADASVSHVTLLGLLEANGSIQLPAIMHFPDQGSFQISASSDDAGPLGYSASRRNVKIIFPPATREHSSLTYRLKVVAIHPKVSGIDADPRFDGFRRDWLNIFQINPQRQLLSNNSGSDSCGYCYYEYADIAEHTPPLAGGVTALDMVRQTLDRIIAGAIVCGMPGYAGYYDHPQDTADTLPSFLIAAEDYIASSRDKPWLAVNYSHLESWADRMLATDNNDNGLIKYPVSGNSNTWPDGRPPLRPSNWWDTIGFGYEDAYANALAYRALLGMVHIAQQTGHTDDRARYRTAVDKLKENYFKTFYDPATGILAGWHSADGQFHDYYFLWVNGIAIHYGLVPPDKANLIMDRLLAKMNEVGYTNFALGLPGNLISVARKDYAHHNPRYGGGTNEDGSDAFQIYENGGATACFAYFTLAALYDLGRIQDGDRILFPMLDAFARGDFQGFGDNGMSKDWKTWNGEPHGYEGLLNDNYYALLAVLDREAALKRQLSGQENIHQDTKRKLVTLSDGRGDLILRLNYNGRCILDQVIVRGREVAGNSGVHTGIRTDGQWLTTKDIATPEVAVDKDTLTVTGIVFGEPEAQIHETWLFTVKPDEIVWRITREYPTDAILEDAAFPEWDFESLSTWTGGILDNGGVIWNKYLDTTNATYGAHFGTVTFWNSQTDDCLRIIPDLSGNEFGAGRFSHQGNGIFSFNYVVSGQELKPKHNLNRFLKNRQDLWASFPVRHSKVSVQFTLKALDYAATYDRGTFLGLDGNEVRDLLNTVPRYGVIDARLTGGNGWRSGYICLHEPFFAEMGLALDQDDYISNFSECLDYERDNAIGSDGRVMSRWVYDGGDARKGSYKSNGFYETRWGWLLDSQPDYVINVAEQFNLTGNRKWLAGQKIACEKALNYLMRREVGDTGLVAMMNDSVKQRKSSDWIDVVWASYENAFVNAALYEALGLWADDEDALGDPGHAAAYRDFAERLKTSFNRPIADGGFWDPTNQWYVYWRDKDGSIHGNNLVTPVNFAATAYGICDDDSRRTAILDRMEQEMQKEGLFSWPLCFFPYQPDEGGGSPFPSYENGDIFLSWNELAIRSYADYEPAIALKYVRNILARYGQDGLSYQRYLRRSQKGAGADILAGNCMAIVGLYRDIYGIQPKPNRLYLEPHLTPELNGTKLRYELRDQLYAIDLNTEGCAVSAGACTLRDSHPFAINAADNGLEYFPDTNTDWAMSVARPDGQPLTIEIESWPDAPDAIRQWTEISQPGDEGTRYVMKHLQPGAVYEVKVNGQLYDSAKADKTGSIEFICKESYAVAKKFKLVHVGMF